MSWTDPSVDRIKAACIPLLKRFIVDTDIELTIKKRGMAPLGGGEIHFKCPLCRTLKSVQVIFIFKHCYILYRYTSI